MIGFTSGPKKGWLLCEQVGEYESFMLSNDSSSAFKQDADLSGNWLSAKRLRMAISVTFGPQEQI